MFVSMLWLCFQVTLLYNLKSQSMSISDYLLEPWARVMSAFLVITPLLCIPLYILVSVYKVGNCVCVCVLV